MSREFWAPEEIATLAAYVEGGLRPREISDRIGRSRAAVIGQARLRGLKFKHGRPEPKARDYGSSYIDPPGREGFWAEHTRFRLEWLYAGQDRSAQTQADLSAWDRLGAPRTAA